MAINMLGVDVYIQHNPKDTTPFVTQHRCWDTDLFVETLRKQAQKEGGKILMINEDMYRKMKT